MVVFVVKRYAVRDTKKWRFTVRKAKIGRYAIRKGEGVSPSTLRKRLFMIRFYQYLRIYTTGYLHNYSLKTP